MEIIIAGFFLTFFLIVLSIFMAYRRRVEGLDSQIKQKVGHYNPAQKSAQGPAPFIVKDQSYSRNPALNSLMEKLKLSKQLKILLEQAGNPIKIDRLFMIMGLTAFLGYFIGSRMMTPMMGLLVAIGGFYVPVLAIKMIKSKRMKAFTKGFPDAIDMMADAIKAGNALSKALLLVANESPDPVGVEFRKTFEEQNLGIPLTEALLNLTNRIDSMDLKLFVTAVSLQKDTGGNLVEILNTISHLIRERFKLIGQIQVFTAQARFSGFIIGSLPIGFILIIRTINPDYINMLFYDPGGRVLLTGAIVLQVMGFLWIKRIMAIKLT